MGEFHSETKEGKIAYNPSAPLDERETWVYALRNGGYTFYFSAHRTNGQGMDIVARRPAWIRRFLATHKIEYVDEPPKEVATAVDERVAIAEEPLEVTPLQTQCSGCGAEYLVDVLPKMDLQIDGRMAQRVVEEYCPDCDTAMISKTTYEPNHTYAHEITDLDPDDFDDSDVEIWEHARRHVD